MAYDPDAPVYRQTEVVTDPDSKDAVQVPDGANDGSNPGPHALTEPTPNEVALDPEFYEGAEEEKAANEAAVSEANARADEAEAAAANAEDAAAAAEAKLADETARADKAEKALADSQKSSK